MVDLHREAATMLVSEWWWIGIGAGAVVLAGAVWWLWWRLPKRQMRSITLGDPKARADIEDNFRKTIGQALGGKRSGACVAGLNFSLKQWSLYRTLISSGLGNCGSVVGHSKMWGSRC
jgi:hypothetical protein